MPAATIPDEDRFVRRQLLSEESEDCLDDDDGDGAERGEGLLQPSQPQRPQRLTASRPVQLASCALIGVVALVLCVVAVSHPSHTEEPRHSSKADRAIKKMGFDDGISMMDGFVKAMKKSSEVMGDAEEILSDTQDEVGGLTDTAQAAVGDDQPDSLTSKQKMAMASEELQEERTDEQDLTPDENQTDGNICYDDEELFENMCYKTCSKLTNKAYPLRSGTNQCCMAQTLADCNAARVMTTDKPCGGFEVSGDREGKSGCPNPPGVCLSNEEAFEGLCYKRCEFLTQGLYPYRSGAASCCNIDPTKNGLACFFGALDKDAVTKPEYAVGGGAGDGRDFTHASPHRPSMSLAEQTTSAPVQAVATVPPLAPAVLAPAVPTPPALPGIRVTPPTIPPPVR